MGQPRVLSQTGVGSTVWYPVDVHRDPVNIGFGVVVTGTVNYTVQHTFVPDLLTAASVAAEDIFPHDTIAAQTTSQDGNYAFPVTGCRVTVNSGTGTAKFTVIQAGIRGG